MSKSKPAHEHDLKKLGDPVSPLPVTPGDDVNVRAIVRFGVILLSAAALVSVLIIVFVQAMSRYEAQADPARPPMGVLQREQGDPDNHGDKVVLPDGGVRLQRQPFALYEEEQKQEREILTSPPAWMDEKVGVVRIPIARAMELVVRRGLPVRSPGEAVAPAAVMPSPSSAAAPTATAPTPAPRPRATATKKKTEKPRVAKPTAEPSAAPEVEP